MCRDEYEPPTVIEGLVATLTTDELETRLDQRIAYYQVKYDDAYKEWQTRALSENDEDEAKARAAKEKFKNAKAKVEHLTVLRANLEGNAIYRLGYADLETLGYITPRYRLV